MICFQFSTLFDYDYDDDDDDDDGNDDYSLFSHFPPFPPFFFNGFDRTNAVYIFLYSPKQNVVLNYAIYYVEWPMIASIKLLIKSDRWEAIVHIPYSHQRI